jgi:uncharacterized protein YndB with AHSA1/START domain
MHEQLIDTPIRHETYIDTDVRTVWETLISADGWDGWFTSGMELDARSGGAIRFRWIDWGPRRITAEDAGVVITVEEPHRFVFSWHEGEFAQPTTVAFTLETAGSGTNVMVEDRGYPDTPEGRRWFADCAAGWGEALTLLKFYLEDGLTYRRPIPDE